MEDFDRDWTDKFCVLIDRGDGNSLILRNVLERALSFLEGHMEAVGLGAGRLEALVG